MKQPEPKTKWIVHLTNGETIKEGSGIARRVKGQDSPWHKLVKYAQKEDLQITALGLIIDDRHVYLPRHYPAGVPLYKCYRKAAADMVVRPDDVEHQFELPKKPSSFYTVLEALMGSQVATIVVDELNPQNILFNIDNVKKKPKK